MASSTQKTSVWASSRRCWRTGKPGVLQSMAPQSDMTEWLDNNNNDIWCWASFQMLICHLYIVFGDVSPQIFWALVFLFWVLRVFNIFWIWALYLINVFQILSPVCGLSFHSLKSVFCRAGDFNFNEVHTINFFFHRLSWWCYIKGSKMALVFWHKMAQCCYFFSSG